MGNQFELYCPHCGSPDRVAVHISTWALLVDDGSNLPYDHEWDDESPASCLGCDFEGTVSLFRGDVYCQACTTGTLKGAIPGTLSNGERCDACARFHSDGAARAALAHQEKEGAAP